MLCNICIPEKALPFYTVFFFFFLEREIADCTTHQESSLHEVATLLNENIILDIPSGKKVGRVYC